MLGEKGSVNPQEIVCYEINNISDFFDNEKIKSEIYNSIGINGFLNGIMEIYKDKSLDIEGQNDVEKLSHYYIAKLLYEKKVIDHIEEFATSKKTLKSCFNGKLDDVNLLWRSLIPVMFSSIKEHFLGCNSWQDYLNRFSEENFENLFSDLSRFIHGKTYSLIKPSHLSSKQLISEIRNALDHTRYVLGADELYIKNPKSEYHKHDFEIEISCTFLLLLILDVYFFVPKNSLGLFLQFDSEIFSNPNHLKFSDFKDKFHIYQYVAKGNHIDDTVIKKREINLSKYLIGDVGEVVKQQSSFKGDNDEFEINVLDEGGLITNYFSKEKFDVKRLQYVAVSLENSLIVPMSILVYYLLIRNNSYKGLESSDLTDDMYGPISQIFSNPVNNHNYCASEQKMFDIVKNLHLDLKSHHTISTNENVSSEKDKILNKLISRLETAKQNSNLQPVLKTFEGCWNCAYNYLLHRNFLFDGNVFKRGEIEITKKELSILCTHLTDVHFITRGIVKTFPNRLKVQMIKMVYLNELIPLKNFENEEKRSEEERIRNALAHDNYIILDGVDQILLRDGYSRASDKWNWEKLYKLSELYENTYKAMDENMKNTKLNVDLNIKNI